MVFYAFFKIGHICDGIIVGHGLEVSSLAIAARIQVGRSRRSSCRKLQVDDSIVPKNDGGDAPSPINVTLHY